MQYSFWRLNLWATNGQLVAEIRLIVGQSAEHSTTRESKEITNDTRFRHARFNYLRLDHGGNPILDASLEFVAEDGCWARHRSDLWKKKARTRRSRPGESPRGLSERTGGGDHANTHDSSSASAEMAMAIASAGTEG